MCLIDWQCSRFSSPAIDLHNLIFGATDSQFRQKEYENLMDHYYKTLATTITRLGSDPEKLFTRSNFEDHLKRFGKFAFLMGPVFTAINLVDPNDIPNLDQYSADLAQNENVDLVKQYSEADQL